MRIFFILLILLPSALSYADNMPPHTHKNILGTGWECDRGYYLSKNECKQIIIPDNAHLNIYGNEWECDCGYYRSGQQCKKVVVPQNAHINMYGNGWECDRGYYRSDNECKQVIVPENAHLNIYGNGWDCDKGYFRSDQKCEKVIVPPNAQLNIYGNGWECDKGFKRVNQSCIPITAVELQQQNELEKKLIEELLRKRSLITNVVGNSCRSSEDAGVVVKEDVCGTGNAIIETTDGWYIAAEHYSGVYFYEGDTVCGQMKTYGFQDLYRSDGAKGHFYIEDWESSIEDAYEELCD